MSISMDEPSQETGIVLTKEQKRRQRARSIAIGLALGALAVLFFAVTIVKLGSGVLTRPM
jgi:predicted nucleic acid-binding Zn ribbon protein